MCDCILQMNEALKPREVVLETGVVLSSGQQLVKVGIRRLSPKRTSNVQLYATYCPFCGEKYPQNEQKATVNDA